MAIAVTLGLVEMLKNSDFVLENKMAELNIKNSKLQDWPDAMWNFTLPWK